MKQLIPVALTCLFGIAACGGGGDGSASDGGTATAGAASASSNGKFVGLWTDKTSSVQIASVLVTANDEIWVINTTSGVPSKGTILDDDQSFRSSDYFLYYGQSRGLTTVPTPEIVSGQLLNKNSINFTVSRTNWSHSATLTYNDIFDQPPQISGWAGTYRNGQLNILQDGSLAGRETGQDSMGFGTEGCSFTGRIRPDDSGKNFFRVTLKFSASQKCHAPGETAAGVLFSNSVNKYLVVVTPSNQGAGFGLY